MGEARSVEDVAEREDVAPAGPKTRVDRDAGRPERDPGGLQAEAFGRRDPPRRHQEVRAGDRLRAAVPLHHQRRASRRVVDAGDGRVLEDFDAFDDQRGTQRRDEFGFVAGQDRMPFDQHDRDTEAAMRQCQLDADRTAAEDDETAREIPQREDRLVGQHGGRVETGDRRQGGARSGGHDEPARPDPLLTDRDRAIVQKRRRSAQHRDAEAFETGNGIVRRDCVDYVSKALLDGAEVDRWFACAKTRHRR